MVKASLNYLTPLRLAGTTRSVGFRAELASDYSFTILGKGRVKKKKKIGENFTKRGGAAPDFPLRKKTTKKPQA